MSSQTKTSPILQWFLTTYVLGPLVTFLPPALVVALAWRFVNSKHTIPGWAVVGMSAVGGLLVFSVGLNVVQWRRQRKPRPQPNLSVVAHGGEQARFWEKPTTAHEMMISGLYDVTNISSDSLTIPRSLLELSVRRLGIIPVRHRIEGDGLRPTDPEERMHRLYWFVRSPLVKQGRAFRARVILVDNLGVYNYSAWETWKYLGH